MDFYDYAVLQMKEWNSLEQQLKSMVEEMTTNETTLKELNLRVSDLQQVTTDRLSGLRELLEHVQQEKLTAESLTLNDMDDDVVIDTVPSVTMLSPMDDSEVESNPARSTPTRRDKTKKSWFGSLFGRRSK